MNNLYAWNREKSIFNIIFLNTMDKITLQIDPDPYGCRVEYSKYIILSNLFYSDYLNMYEIDFKKINHLHK